MKLRNEKVPLQPDHQLIELKINTRKISEMGTAYPNRVKKQNCCKIY